MLWPHRALARSLGQHLNVVWFAAVALLAAYLLRARAWPLKAAVGSALDRPAPGVRTAVADFTVATYNIHRGRGLDRRTDLVRTGAVLAGCDVAGLQEVQGPEFWSPGNQAERLAQLLELGVHFAPTRRRAFFPHRGNALLTRFPVSHWRRQPLFPNTGKSYRNLAVYHMHIGGRTVYVLNTHLSRPERQRAPLAAVIDAFSRYYPAILLGDFNAVADHPAVLELLPPDAVDALALGGVDSQRVDWILVRGLKVKAAWSASAGPSDHPFFAARLTFD